MCGNIAHLFCNKGSSIFKAGFARDDASTHVFPYIVTNRNSSGMCSAEFVGDNAPKDASTYIE